MTLIQKTCAVCGKGFAVPPWRDGTAKTCSQKCRGVLIAKAYADRRIEHQCKWCGKHFKIPKCFAGKRVYCSYKCAGDAQRGVSSGPKGGDHYLWNGGKTYHYEGYLYVTMPDHPFGGHSGYVFEHRVIMETWMREVAPDHGFLVRINGESYLRPEISVHHINEVKRDNRRKNLLACTVPAHRAIHNGIAPMRGEVWPEIEGLQPFRPRVVQRHCELCGSEFSAKRSDVDRGGGKFCSKNCFKNRDRTKFKVSVL